MTSTVIPRGLATAELLTGGNQTTLGGGQAISRSTHGRTLPRPTTVPPCASIATACKSQAKRAPATSTHPLGRFRIGGNSIWPTEFFNGLVDEVRIYNRALTAAEIQTDMNTSIGGGTPPPDTTPPPSRLPAAAGATVSSSVTLAADANDNVTVAGVQFRVDGVNVGSEDTAARCPSPTAQRDFRISQRPTTLVRVYQARDRMPAAVTIRVQVMAGNVVAVERTDTLAADAFAATRAADYVVDLPLEQLSQGPHLLTLEAVAGRHAVKRHLRFTVH